MSDRKDDLVSRSRDALDRALSDPSEVRVSAAELVRNLREKIDELHRSGITYRRIAELLAPNSGLDAGQIERAITRDNRARGLDGRSERYARPAAPPPPEPPAPVAAEPVAPPPLVPPPTSSTPENSHNSEIDDDTPTSKSRRLESYA